MKGRVTLFATVLLVLAMGTSAMLLRRVAEARGNARLDDALYLNSPKLLKRLSLGYDGLAADIYWTRAVQYYGTIHAMGGGKYELLWPLLNITTQLDPHLIAAYEFGGSFIEMAPPNGAGMPKEAIQLVEHGIANNPYNWRLYYDLGFIYYDLKDYRSASEAFLRGSKVPKAHPFLAILAARMAEHGGELETARMLWNTTYQTAYDKDIRANAAAHLRALQAADDVMELERRVQIYKQRVGRLPRSFQEMTAAGLLRGTPRDPLGHDYQLWADGRVMVSDPDDLPFLEKGVPPWYKPSGVPKIAPAQ